MPAYLTKPRHWYRFQYWLKICYRLLVISVTLMSRLSNISKCKIKKKAVQEQTVDEQL